MAFRFCLKLQIALKENVRFRLSAGLQPTRVRVRVRARVRVTVLLLDVHFGSCN